MSTTTGLRIEDFRVTGVSIPAKARRLQRRHKFFVPGPIPVALFRQLKSYHALKVWMLLQARQRRGYSMRLSRREVELFGLSKRMAQRGLVELERLGLARVERHPGKSAVVELLAVEDEA